MELFTPQQIKNLNELELLVYQYIIEHPNTVPFMRIREWQRKRTFFHHHSAALLQKGGL